MSSAFVPLFFLVVGSYTPIGADVSIRTITGGPGGPTHGALNQPTAANNTNPADRNAHFFRCFARLMDGAEDACPTQSYSSLISVRPKSAPPTRRTSAGGMSAA